MKVQVPGFCKCNASMCIHCIHHMCCLFSRTICCSETEVWGVHAATSPHATGECTACTHLCACTTYCTCTCRHHTGVEAWRRLLLLMNALCSCLLTNPCTFTVLFWGGHTCNDYFESRTMYNVHRHVLVHIYMYVPHCLHSVQIPKRFMRAEHSLLLDSYSKDILEVEVEGTAVHVHVLCVCSTSHLQVLPEAAHFLH